VFDDWIVCAGVTGHITTIDPATGDVLGRQHEKGVLFEDVARVDDRLVLLDRRGSLCVYELKG
jgi:hypothetical protein